MTTVGNAQIDTAQSKFGGASGLFDGTGDYLTTPGDVSDFSFGSAVFTIDCWVRFAALSGPSVIIGNFKTGDTPRAYIFYYNHGSTELRFGYCENGADTPITASGTWSPSVDTWYHVAVIRTGDTIRLFVDGSQVGSDASVTAGATINAIPAGKLLHIAQEGNGSYVNGWIDELRVSKGIARWITTFTPASSAYSSDAQTVLLLHMDGTDASTTFTDSSAQISNSNFLIF